MHAYEIERYEADLPEPYSKNNLHARFKADLREPRYARQPDENAYTEAVLLETSYSNISLSNNPTSDYPTDIQYEVRLEQQPYKSSATTTSLRRTPYGTSYIDNVLTTPSVYIFGREVPLE